MNFKWRRRRTYVNAIAVASIEWILREQRFDVAQTGDFKLLRFAFDHFTMKGRNQRRWIQQQRTIGQLHVTLLNAAQVVARCSRLSNGSSRQIQQFVAVLFDFRK